MRLIFMGTPEFSVPPLEALVAAGHEVAAVYTQPPRPAGRGKKERPSPVETQALKMGLTVRHPASLKSPDEQAAFSDLKADIAVVVAYGLILPRAILEAPVRGCLNIHASLLPRWRGAAPIHRAVMAGDRETGVGIMQMEAGLDTGPVLLEKRIAIGDQDTTGDLHDRLSDLGAQAIVEALSNLNDLRPRVQDDALANYAAKIDKAEARINWTDPAQTVDRLIRGLSPFPGAWCEIDGERVKILRSRLCEGQGAPGTVLDEACVACGDGAVELTLLQKAGKRALSAKDYLRGHSLPERLS